MDSSLADKVDFIAIDLIPLELRQVLILVQIANLLMIDGLHVGGGIITNVRAELYVHACFVLRTVCSARVIRLRFGLVRRIF